MIDPELSERIQHATRLISKSRHLVVFTGAGISTPSGIPDFRGEKEGLWQRYDPMQVASRTAFYKNPELFFDWFRPLFLKSWTALPNAAHLGLATLENAHLVKSVITQNIDGLHQKADSQKVYELHGTALVFACQNCKSSQPAADVYNQFLSGTLISTCSNCGKILKPDVVLFEEPLPENTWHAAENEVSHADLLLVIGSSLEVYPASTLPQQAVNRGSKLIINNLSSTSLDAQAEVLIPLDAAEFMPLLVKQLLGY
jgi:NAD-dependent deacetylase